MSSTSAPAPHGSLIRMRPRPDMAGAVVAHFTRWHRTVGRELPGTRLHLVLDTGVEDGELTALHVFENATALRRCLASPAHATWLADLNALLEQPLTLNEIFVRWNVASDARPHVSVSIDRDVHQTVQDLIGRLLDRYPRTPAEDMYLSMLQSISDDYEQEYPATAPEEGEPR